MAAAVAGSSAIREDYEAVASSPSRAWPVPEETEEEDAEEEESDSSVLPAKAPGRLRPFAAASGAAVLVAMLLAFAAGATLFMDPNDSRLRGTGSALRRTEEADGDPLCGSLPEFQRYANAKTLARVKCSCPEGQAKQLCDKGTRSQNACCKPAADGTAERKGVERSSVLEDLEAVGEDEDESEDEEDSAPKDKEERKGKGKKGKGKTGAGKKSEEEEEETDEALTDCRFSGKGACTLMLTVHDSVSIDGLESLAEEFEPEAKPTVMKALKLASLEFGEGSASVAKCCKAYEQLRANKAVSAVEFDASTSIAGGGASLSLSGELNAQ